MQGPRLEPMIPRLFTLWGEILAIRLIDQKNVDRVHWEVVTSYIRSDSYKVVHRNILESSSLKNESYQSLNNKLIKCKNMVIEHIKKLWLTNQLGKWNY
jgi:hypothetical protein